MAAATYRFRMENQVKKTEEEWKAELSREEYHVLRQSGTERPFTGEYVDTKQVGVYTCRACGQELFRSEAKFDSHCGWPSFYQPTEGDAVTLIEDRHDGHEARRGALRPLRQPPRARLRGRGLRDPDRPALVHQLGVAQAGSGGAARSSRPGAPCRG